MNTIIENNEHHYSISLELDDELKAWIDEQINPGGYLEHLIAEDRDRQLYPEQEEPLSSPQEPEKRMAGEYEIIQAFHIGDREIVLGENQNVAPEERYLCAYGDRNEIDKWLRWWELFAAVSHILLTLGRHTDIIFLSE